jgi:hypothetical protein
MEDHELQQDATCSSSWQLLFFFALSTTMSLIFVL